MYFDGFQTFGLLRICGVFQIFGRCENPEWRIITEYHGKSRNMAEYHGISRNMAEYHRIWRNITEYGGIS